MSGHGNWSGQTLRERRAENDGMGGGTQTDHPDWSTVDDIQSALGVSRKDAQDFYDAVNGGDDGGFTRGWDTAIRAYQQGKSADDVIAISHASYVVNTKYGGDKDAYIKAVAKKARDCERLIDAAPKWNGSELMRGFHDMTPELISELTKPGVAINLNAGTASWTTSERTARSFSGAYYKPGSALIVHVKGNAGMRATSIEGISHYNHRDHNSEWEVLASRRNSYEFISSWVDSSGVTHAEYRIDSTNYDWRKRK